MKEPPKVFLLGRPSTSLGQISAMEMVRARPFAEKYRTLARLNRSGKLDALIGHPFPQDLTSFPKPLTGMRNPSSLREELEWYCLVIENYLASLSTFLSLRERIDICRLTGNWVEVNSLIENIKKHYGLSSYYFERKFEIYNSLGEDALLEKASEELLRSHLHAITKFSLTANNFRHQAIYPYTAYFTALDRNLKKSSRWGIQILELIYSVDSNIPLSTGQVSVLLNISCCKPILDQYELLVYTIRLLKSRQLSREDGSAVDWAIKRLSERVSDRRIQEASISSKSVESERIACLSEFDSNDLVTLLSQGGRLAEHYKAKPNSYIGELGSILDIVKDASGYGSAIIQNLQSWASRYGRSRISDAISALSRYFQGMASLGEVSLELESNIFNDSSCSGGVMEGFPIFAQIESAKKIYKSICEDGDFRGRARFILTQWKINPWIVASLNIAIEFRAYVKKHNPEVIADFSILVALGLVEEGVPFTAALDAFMFFVGADSILDLLPLLAKEDKWIFDIFAETCCSLQILKELPGIGETIQEVRAERVRILKSLINNKELRTDHLKNEVFELEKRNRIDGANGIIDQSRMMVDRETLQQRIESRYLSKANDFSVGDLSELFIHSFQAHAVGIFLLDQHCGLDAVMSGRIRHGNLRERLRSPFSRAGLIFVKRSGKYEPPDNWRIAFSYDDSFRDQLYSLLTDFTKAIDNCINRFINERVQINIGGGHFEGFIGMLIAKKSPEGFIRTEELLLNSAGMVWSQKAAINSMSSLVNVIIDSMWQALRPQLEEVRFHITEYLKNSLVSILDEFSEKLDFLPEYQRNLLRDACGRCRFEINSVCEETSRWFDLPQDLTPPQVDVGEMVELVAESISRYIGGVFSPIIFLGENCQVAAKYFSDLYDLLNLCFINIVEHSGLEPDRAEPAISIYLGDGGDYIFECSNFTREDASSEVEKARLQIEENEKAGVGYKLNDEGKSGLAKAANLFSRGVDVISDISAHKIGDRFVLRRTIPSATFRI